MIQYRTLCIDEITRELFSDFIRHQIVTKCWRRENAEWIIKDALLSMIGAKRNMKY